MRSPYIYGWAWAWFPFRVHCSKLQSTRCNYTWRWRYTTTSNTVYNIHYSVVIWNEKSIHMEGAWSMVSPQSTLLHFTVHTLCLYRFKVCSKVTARMAPMVEHRLWTLYAHRSRPAASNFFFFCFLFFCWRNNVTNDVEDTIECTTSITV